MFKLYDSKGNMFEISNSDRVRVLLDQGWTPWHPDNPPSFGKTEVKSSTVKRKKKTSVPHTTKSDDSNSAS